MTRLWSAHVTAASSLAAALLQLLPPFAHVAGTTFVSLTAAQPAATAAAAQEQR